MTSRRGYAEGTEVPVDRSIAEIRSTVRRYGATGFMHIERQTEAVIAFETRDRRVMFRVAMPDPEERRFTHTPQRGERRSPSAQTAAWDQACKERWRALALVIKAKLEAVASGIVEFDDEFLAYIALPTGETVGDRVRPAIGPALTGRPLPPLLPGAKQ